jgi:hypothetical protein
VSYSMGSPEGVGHQYTPPFAVDVTPSDRPAIGVDDLAGDYGQLCVGAVDAAMSARDADHTRANAVPGPYGQ